MPVEQLPDTAFYHPSQEQDPYHLQLITDICTHLDGTVPNIEFSGKRARTGELLIGVPYQTTHAILAESLGTLMGKHTFDLPIQLRSLTTKRCGVDGGVALILPYLDGRDDRLFRADGTSFLALYLDTIRSATRETGVESTTEGKDITAVFPWDAHSPTVIKALNKLNDENSIHVLPLTMIRLFAERIKALGFVEENAVALSPDLGALYKSRIAAEELGLPLFLVHKTRPEPNIVKIEGFYRDGPSGIEEIPPDFLNGRRVFIFDDMYDTTRTSALEAEAVNNLGAEVVTAATHGIFSLPEAQQYLGQALKQGIIEKALVSDTLPSHRNLTEVEVVSIAEPTAILMKMIAGVKVTEEEKHLLAKCVYDPGPEKDELEEEFVKGTLRISEPQDSLHPQELLAQTATIFAYQQYA